jgi:hypothetical protein
VLLIGYDRDGNYIIKNQWGTSWGDKGYEVISKDRDCGISAYPYRLAGDIVCLQEGYLRGVGMVVVEVMVGLGLMIFIN